MAWTDILQGARSGLNASLDRRQSKRMGSLGMLNDTLGQISGQRHATSEREAGQLFAQDEAIKQREFEGGLAGQQIQANIDLEELRNENDVALEGARNTHQRELVGLDDEKAIARESQRYANELDVLQKDIDARIAAAEAAAKQPREHYEEQSQAFGGRTYTWTSDQEYDLVKLKMQRDMLMDQIALEKAGADSDKGMAGAVFDAEFNKLMISRPDLWPMGASWYVDVDDETYNSMRDSFHRALLTAAQDGYITSDMIPELMTRFNDYVTPPAPDVGGGEAGQGAGDVSALLAAINLLLGRESQYQAPTFNITWPDNMVPGFTAGNVPEDIGRDNPGELRNPIVEPGGENSPAPRTQAEEDTALSIMQGLLQNLSGARKRDAQGWIGALNKDGLMEDTDWIGLTEWLQQIQSQLGAK